MLVEVYKWLFSLYSVAIFIIVYSCIYLLICCVISRALLELRLRILDNTALSSIIISSYFLSSNDLGHLLRERVYYDHVMPADGRRQNTSVYDP